MRKRENTNPFFRMIVLYGVLSYGVRGFYNIYIDLFLFSIMDLFEQLTSFENLHTAYLLARRAKRYRYAILRFSVNVEAYIAILRKELLHKTYVHGIYRTFVVTDSKKRTIQAAPFRDRVLHHALCFIIEPLFEKTFIYDSYACRVSKGTHHAVYRLQSYLRSLMRIREREREREQSSATSSILFEV